MSTTETIRRLTIEEVKAAADKTGLKLKRGITFNGLYACPIGSVGVATGKAYFICETNIDLDETAKRLGLSEAYTSGFIHGFDRGKPDNDFGSFQYKLGFIDGRAIAAALLPTEAD